MLPTQHLSINRRSVPSDLYNSQARRFRGSKTRMRNELQAIELRRTMEDGNADSKTIRHKPRPPAIQGSPPRNERQTPIQTLDSGNTKRWPCHKVRQNRRIGKAGCSQLWSVKSHAEVTTRPSR